MMSFRDRRLVTTPRRATAYLGQHSAPFRSSFQQNTTRIGYASEGDYDDQRLSPADLTKALQAGVLVEVHCVQQAH